MHLEMNLPGMYAFCDVPNKLSSTDLSLRARVADSCLYNVSSKVNSLQLAMYLLSFVPLGISASIPRHNVMENCLSSNI